MNNQNMIIEQSNKKILWETLHSNGIFSKFNEDQIEHVKQIFDEEINDEYFKNINNIHFNLLQSNRSIVINVINKLKMLQQNNMNSIENKFKQKEKEFSDLIEKPKPPDINFSDSKEDDNFNIDDSLNKIKNERNYINENNEMKTVKNDIQNMKEKIQNMESMINSLTQQFAILNKNTTNTNTNDDNNITFHSSNNLSTLIN